MPTRTKAAVTKTAAAKQKGIASQADKLKKAEADIAKALKKAEADKGKAAKKAEEAKAKSDKSRPGCKGCCRRSCTGCTRESYSFSNANRKPYGMFTSLGLLPLPQKPLQPRSGFFYAPLGITSSNNAIPLQAATQ